MFHIYLQLLQIVTCFIHLNINILKLRQSVFLYWQASNDWETERVITNSAVPLSYMECCYCFHCTLPAQHQTAGKANDYEHSGPNISLRSLDQDETKSQSSVSVCSCCSRNTWFNAHLSQLQFNLCQHTFTVPLFHHWVQL